MSMRIKNVQQVHEKGSGRINEDDILIRDGLYAVFDGMSSLVSYQDDEGKTGGKLASEIAKGVFQRGGEKPLIELGKMANREILERMIKGGVDIRHKENLWSSMVAAVRIKNDYFEFFNVGDCLILQVQKDDSYQLVTPYFNQDLETMLRWKELAEKKTDNIWDALEPQTDKVRRELNIKYGSLNGKEHAINFFRAGKGSVRNLKSLILFTDGLLLPKENPKDPENWELFIELYQNHGLKGILEHIREVEKSDPKCWKYPRFKQHDDAAAIGIDFSQ